MFADRKLERRRGAILVAVMVCVAIAAVIFVSIARTAGVCRRLGDAHLWQVQAGWLAESALERAAARLAADPDYTGETWTLAAAKLGTPDAAVVTIEIEGVPGEPGRRTVRVRADYPDHPHHRCRETRQVTVHVPQ